MLSPEQNEQLRSSYHDGTLRVCSVSPTGEVEWKRVTAVHRAQVGPESIHEVSTERGPLVLTGGHRVFLSPVTKTEAENLRPGDQVLGVEHGVTTRPTITATKRLPGREWMYDLTAEDWHNFVLHRSGVVISNSPDRNYRFRPPEHEGKVGCYNQVFGYIWTDEELLEYLRISLDKWNMQAPKTPHLCSLNTLCQEEPSWKAALLWGAVVHAAMALSFNWVSEEFNYSIGGISLDIEKSSKYQSLKENAESQWDKLVEMKARTTKYMRGLQQPKYSAGVRSAFGPATGRGIMSPRSFL